MNSSTRILIADDHPLFREALALQLSRFWPQATVEEVDSFEDVLASSRRRAPDLLILDFRMPGMSFEALAGLADEFRASPILVVSGYLSPTEANKVFQAGARGFLPKTSTGDHFEQTMRLLMAGGISVPPDYLFRSEKTAPPDKTLADLTPRESAVLQAVARGRSNKEIARELDLAEVTVKMHMSAVFRKLAVRSRTEAARKLWKTEG